MSKLLRPIGNTALGGVSHFVVDEEVFKKANIRRVCVSKNFEDLFLGTKEESIPECNIGCGVVVSKTSDKVILDQIGDSQKVKLYHFFELIVQQSHGEEGILAIDGKPNIIYIHDKTGVLWAVYTCYCREWSFWRLEASSITHPAGWNAGCRILQYQNN